jgi:histidinol dehydrogenase
MIRIVKVADAALARAKAPENPRDAQIISTAADIIARVRRDGDAALAELTAKYDGARISVPEVTADEIQSAYASMDAPQLSALRRAAARITAFHKPQVREGYTIADEPGITLGQRVIPLDKAAIYVPGGTAAYPSTVLMNAIPARLAGVRLLVMATPPRSDGTIPPAVLTAARIAGVDRIFKMGGAQAIAALAYGTQSIPAVDKIVGPGNAYVAAAKRLVFGTVDIDMIAGPSEIMIIADSGNKARYLAADMLSQAEHDSMASAILLTDSLALAEAVALEIEIQLATLPRGKIARASVEENGKIVLVDSIAQAIRLADAYAPEHLELCVEDATACLPLVRNAGSVFLGRYSPEALGDYWAGPNHTLPTGGTARFSSPLSVDDFVKRSQYISFSREALREAKDSIISLAAGEGLEAHARSVAARFEAEA